jgi:hypothetical protein
VTFGFVDQPLVLHTGRCAGMLHAEGLIALQRRSPVIDKIRQPGAKAALADQALFTRVGQVGEGLRPAEV